MFLEMSTLAMLIQDISLNTGTRHQDGHNFDDVIVNAICTCMRRTSQELAGDGSRLAAWCCLAMQLMS